MRALFSSRCVPFTTLYMGAPTTLLQIQTLQSLITTHNASIPHIPLPIQLQASARMLWLRHLEKPLPSRTSGRNSCHQPRATQLALDSRLTRTDWFWTCIDSLYLLAVTYDFIHKHSNILRPCPKLGLVVDPAVIMSSPVLVVCLVSCLGHVSCLRFVLSGRGSSVSAIASLFRVNPRAAFVPTLDLEFRASPRVQVVPARTSNFDSESAFGAGQTSTGLLVACRPVSVLQGWQPNDTGRRRHAKAGHVTYDHAFPTNTSIQV